MTNRTNTNQTGQFLKDRLAPIVGVGAIVIYIAALVLMVRMLSAEDVQWARATFLLSGVEAIALAAAGFFFGREVNRQRAEKAEAVADSANTKADKATNEAAEAKANGKALASVIRSQAQRPEGVPFGAPPGTKPAQSDLDDLVRLADTLFPIGSD